MIRSWRTRAAIAAAVVFVLGIPTVGGAAVRAGDQGEIRQTQEAIPGQYIVTLKPNTDSPREAQRLGREHRATVDRVYQRVLKGFSARMSEADALALSRDPAVQSVEEDAVLRALDSQSNPPWGLNRIDQHDLPLNTTYDYFATAAPVRVYVLDTGIRPTHQDFGGRASIGADFVGDGQNGQDCDGHGTHVAGIAGGSTYGVAKHVSLVAVRVLNCNGFGSTSNVLAGIEWVTTHAIKPAVANMSLGSDSGNPIPSLNNAVTASIATGITYTVAAGNNNGQDACTASPAGTPNAITVASSTITDLRSSFSNIGGCVDLFAPGSSIPSTWNTSDTATMTESGTSMAAPHAAGVAAQYLSQNPTSTPAQVTAALTSNASADKISNPGVGTPNLLLYNGFIPAAQTAPGPPRNLTLGTAIGEVPLSWTAPASDGGSPIAGYAIYRGTSSGGENPTPIATPAANETSYMDFAVTNGITYFYQVAAVNAVGETRSDEKSILFTSPTCTTARSPCVFILGVNRSVSTRRFAGVWSSWQN